MNNHVIQSMTLQDAKAKCELAIECWANSADASVKPRELVEKLHHQKILKLTYFLLESFGPFLISFAFIENI